MNSLFVSIPRWLQKLFPRFLWRVATNKKEIYLTFDDGPTPQITDWVIAQLEAVNAKATFFCIGKNISENPALFQKLIEKGHAIGNHTYDHLKGWNVSDRDYLESFEKTDNLLSSYKLNNKSLLFRPPYGKIKRSQVLGVKKQGYQIVMWDVLSLDFDENVNPEKCLENVLKNVTNGSVVVFHDSIKASKNVQYVLPIVLTHFKEKGFEFKAFA